jgi:hypothetical protein
VQDVIKQLTLPLPTLNSEYLEKTEREKKNIAIEQIKMRGFGFFNDITKEDKEREWRKRTFDEVIKKDLQDFSPSIQELVKDAFLNN